MTPSLRKRHQNIWWFLMPVLLVIWVLGMMATTSDKQEDIVPSSLLTIATEPSIKLIQGTSNNTKEIEIQLHHPISSPQTLVYLAPNEKATLNNCLLLGRIDGKGIFKFPLDGSATAMPQKVVKGYDAIHQKELFSVIINN